MRNEYRCRVEEYIYHSQTFTIGVKQVNSVLKRCIRNQNEVQTMLALRKKRRDIKCCKRQQLKKQDFENRHCHHEDKYLRDDFDLKTPSTKKRRKWLKERRKKPNHRKKFYEKLQTSVEEVDDKPFTFKLNQFECKCLKAIEDASDYYDEVVQHCRDYNVSPYNSCKELYSDKTHTKGEPIYMPYFFYDDYYDDCGGYMNYPTIYKRHPNPFIEFRLDSIYRLSFKSMIDYPRSSKLILEKTYYEDLNYRMKKFSLSSSSPSMFIVEGTYYKSNTYELFKSYSRFIYARCLLKNTYNIDYDVIQRIASYI
jgi:hypothetical protein